MAVVVLNAEIEPFENKPSKPMFNPLKSPLPETFKSLIILRSPISAVCASKEVTSVFENSNIFKPVVTVPTNILLPETSTPKALSKRYESAKTGFSGEEISITYKPGTPLTTVT